MIDDMFKKLFRKSKIDSASLEEYISKNYTPIEDIKPKAAFFAHMKSCEKASVPREISMPMCEDDANFFGKAECFNAYTVDDSALNERLAHMSDTFTDYLMYLIDNKGMNNAEVYKRALVDKKTFSKIKTNSNYHPQKITVLCLCIGAKLNLDESRDLLARAGYALSPCDITDVIFSYFIENQIYDMIELDIQLEEHGVKCIIS